MTGFLTRFAVLFAAFMDGTGDAVRIAAAGEDAGLHLRRKSPALGSRNVL